MNFLVTLVFVSNDVNKVVTLLQFDASKDYIVKLTYMYCDMLSHFPLLSTWDQEPNERPP